MQAIDVSLYQGNIDFTKVKNADVIYINGMETKINGIGAVIIKAGEDLSVDPKFERNIQGFMSVNIPVGVYWFGRAIDTASAKAEAKKCIETVKKYKLNLPIYYDYEYASLDTYKAKTGKDATKTVVTNLYTTFCGEIKAAGLRAGYYTNPDMLSRYITESKLKGYSKWLAYWIPNQPSNAGDIWQSGIGRVNGINGDVDLDTLINEKLIQGMNGGGSNGGNTAPVESSITVSMPTLTVGSQGKAVKIWQIIIGEMADGIFGSKTLTKTQNFQKAVGLKVDGIVGPQSWTKGLNSV